MLRKLSKDNYDHYPLGRSALDNLIPKPTTAVAATLKSLPSLGANISSFSYRVPTSIVGSANLVLQLNKTPSSKEELVETLLAFDAQHRWPLFGVLWVGDFQNFQSYKKEDLSS